MSSVIDPSAETDARLRPSRAAVLADAWDSTGPYRPVLVLVVLLFAGFALTQDTFATSTNVQNMLTSVATIWVVSMGMTFVLLAGAVDLSVGAAAALCGIIFAKLIGLDVPGGVALLLAVGAGVVIGAAVNGVLIGKLRLSFFVVTLASMTALTGAVLLWTNTESISVSSAPVADTLAIDTVLGLRMPIWIMIATFGVALYVQRRTYFGRDVYAVGGSETAARLAGIRTARTTVLVFALVGGCAALGGCIAVSRIGAATSQVDQTLALQAAAAVLVGGTSIFGGSGGVQGTAAGVLFIGILANGLSLAGVQSFWQLVVTGLILIAATLGDRLRLGSFARMRRRPLAAATGADG